MFSVLVIFSVCISFFIFYFEKKSHLYEFCLFIFLVPQDGFLLGCVFAIADYPEQMADKQLLATWKRVRPLFSPTEKQDNGKVVVFFFF